MTLLTEKKKKVNYLCVHCVAGCLPACLSVCAYRAHRGQQKVPDPLELEFEAVVSLLTWVLRTELRTSEKGKAASALNHGAAALDQTLPAFKSQIE